MFVMFNTSQLYIIVGTLSVGALNVGDLNVDLIVLKGYLDVLTVFKRW